MLGNTVYFRNIYKPKPNSTTDKNHRFLVCSGINPRYITDT